MTIRDTCRISRPYTAKIAEACVPSGLSRCTSFFDDTEQRIRGLNSLFDTKSAPAEFLNWLAGWLALDLDEHWTEEKKRSAIAQVFALYARRGTAEGLRAALRFFLGNQAQIEEPILYANWWALSSTQTVNKVQCLGSTPLHRKKRKVRSSAQLPYDESSLITIDEFGAPLFR